MEDSSTSSATSGPSDEPSTTERLNSTTERVLSERELIRLEFYRTYDVMTGVRIAATLGGFFGLMVLLVLYKSRCKGRSESDEHLEAAITAVVEDEKVEDDDDVMAALTMSGVNFYGPRRSLGNMSAPPYMRFASFAGGTAMMQPPTSKSGLRGRASLPVSDIRYHMYSSRASPTDERNVMAEPPVKVHKEVEEEEDSFEEGGGHFLRVPGSSRRLSSITCSSSDASYLYLERRTSALEMGFPPRPSICKTDKALSEAPWDFYYPIDIQVIQPTPEMTPAGSEANLHLRPEDRSKATLSVPGQAPLASMTSSGLSTEAEGTSLTVSDTVFIDEDPEIDTEDEIEDELSTDSEADQHYTQVDKDCLAATQRHPSQNPFADPAPAEPDVVLALKTGSRQYSPKPSRRFSAPADRKLPTGTGTGNPRLVPFSSTGDDDEQFPACSKTVLGLTQITRLELPLPEVHRPEISADPEAIPMTQLGRVETRCQLEVDKPRNKLDTAATLRSRQKRLDEPEMARASTSRQHSLGTDRSGTVEDIPLQEMKSECFQSERRVSVPRTLVKEENEFLRRRRETRSPESVRKVEKVVVEVHVAEVKSEVDSGSRVSSSSAQAPSFSVSGTQSEDSVTSSRGVVTSVDSVTSRKVAGSESCSISGAERYTVPGSTFSKSLERLQPSGDAPADRDANQTGLNKTGFLMSTSHSCDHLVQNVQEVRLDVNKSLPSLPSTKSQETLF
nr:PREDICTED: uncharacterized protein LOC109032113 [Bemisia tabaci]